MSAVVSFPLDFQLKLIVSVIIIISIIALFYESCKL